MANEARNPTPRATHDAEHGGPDDNARADPESARADAPSVDWTGLYVEGSDPPRPEPELVAAFLEAAENRRATEDQSMWSVPALTIAAQAFVLTIVVNSATTQAGRAVACGVGGIILLAAALQMRRHQRYERSLSRWLDNFERALRLPRLHDATVGGEMERTADMALSTAARSLARPFYRASDLWLALLITLIALYVVLFVLTLTIDVFAAHKGASAAPLTSSNLHHHGGSQPFHDGRDHGRRHVRKER